MNIYEVIHAALDKYDNNNKEFESIIKKTKYFIPNKETSTLYIYNDKKEKIYEFHYDFLGTYLTDKNRWIWSWSIPTQNQKNIYLSRQILNYGLDLETYDQLKPQLISSSYYITNSIHLDINLALSLYITKKKYIFKATYNTNTLNKDDISDPYILYVEGIQDNSMIQYLLL